MKDKESFDPIKRSIKETCKARRKAMQEETVSSEKNEKVMELAAKELAGTSRIDKKFNPQWIKDFITFKIMIVPKILTFLYLLATIIVIIYGFSANVFIGILLIFLAPFLVHMAFEFAMLFFAILDILREIRDKLK